MAFATTSEKVILLLSESFRTKASGAKTAFRLGFSSFTISLFKCLHKISTKGTQK